MNSRERVLMTLNHEQPDRPPIDVGGMVTSFTYGAYENIKQYFGLKEPKADIGGFKVMINIDEEVLERCHADFRTHFFSPKGSRWESKWIDDKKFVDPWGVTFRDVGDYYEMIKYPFDGDITIDDIDKYDWPDFSDKKLYEGIHDTVKMMYEQSEYAICGSVCCNVMERIQWLRGLQAQLMDMYIDEELACAMLDKSVEMIMAYLENYLPLVSEYIDVLFYGDDLATQESLLFSPDVYRKIVKPRQAKVFDYIKKHSHAKIFYHCCGAATGVIDDLHEIGVDILNPIQPLAKGMDLNYLKKQFGKKIVFWGAIDEQELLPHGTIDEVIRETRRTIEILGKDGGYVCAPAHNVQSDVPIENFIAMCDTASNITCIK